VVCRRIIGEATKALFVESFPPLDKAAGSGGEEDTGPYAAVLRWFADGNMVTLSDEQPQERYEAELARVPGLLDLARDASGDPRERFFAAELVLEGLTQHLKLAREDLDSQISYKELVKLQLLRPRRDRGPFGEN